ALGAFVPARAHATAGGLVGGPLASPAHPAPGGEGGRLRHPGQLHGEVAIGGLGLVHGCSPRAGRGLASGLYPGTSEAPPGGELTRFALFAGLMPQNVRCPIRAHCRKRWRRRAGGQGFTIAGPLPNALFCSTESRTGLFVANNGSVTVDDNRFEEIRAADPALRGCQNGIAIRVGRQASSSFGTATITNNEFATYQKGAIVV